VNTFFSTGNKRSYTDFKKQIPSEIQSLFDALREFCFSLGENVIEDVRMHRIVFCKSITFRWFLDIEPERDAILLKIKKSRKEPQKTIRLSPNESLEPVKKILKEAFDTIR
jgi:predicted transport protein